MNKANPVAVLKLLADGEPYTMGEYKAIAKASGICPSRYLKPEHEQVNLMWSVSLNTFREAVAQAWEEHEKRTRELLSLNGARILR